jgi:WD40 repeat protein
MEFKLTRQAVFSGHQGAVYCVAPAVKDGFFLSGGSDTQIVEWDVSENAPPRIIARSAGVVYSMLVLRHASMLFIGNNKGGIHVVDLEQKKEIHYLMAHQSGVFDLKWMPNTHEIWAAGSDGVLSIWDAETFKNKERLKISNQKIRKIEACADYSQVALACSDGNIYLLDANRTVELLNPEADAVNALAFSPNGNWLLSGTKNAHLQVWDWPNRKLVAQIPAHNFALYGIHFMESGKHFITISRDKTIKLWDAENFGVLQRIDKETGGHINSVNSGFWDENLAMFISGSDDRSAMAWKFEKK